MLSSTLIHNSRQHIYHTFLHLPLPLGCRSIFYPSGPKPVYSSNTGYDFQYTNHPSLSRQQFEDARNFRASNQSSTLVGTTSEGFLQLISPKDVLDKPVGPPEELWRRNTQRYNDLPPGPFDGRTIEINSGDSITKAWARLNATLKTNNVRQELRQTARHEQKGEKRRRLRSERWRRKFADEVRKKVRLVIEMRNRDRMWGAKH